MEKILEPIKNYIRTFLHFPTWKKVGLIIVCVQWILSLIAIITVAALGFLSPESLTVMILILILFGVSSFILQHSSTYHLAGKIISIFLCLLLIVGDGILIRANTFLDKVSSNEKKVEEKDTEVSVDPFIVYISGNDAFGELAVDGTSDVNMLVCVNPQSAQVLLVNTPRDFYIELPGVSKGMRDKLTHAGMYGMKAQQAAIEKLYGIDINYYVWLNFSSFIDIIEAIGGIDVDNEYEFVSNDGFYFPAGPQHLDGEYALHFARERKALEDGDFGRGRHQQMVIRNMISQLTSVNSLTTYNALLEAIERNCTTNVPKNRMTEIVKYQMSNKPNWNVVSVQAEGEIMAQACYTYNPQVLSVVMPYKESITNIKKMIKDLQDGLTPVAKQMDENSDYSYYSEPDPVDWSNYYDIEGLGDNPLDKDKKAKEETTSETEETSSEDESSEEDTSEESSEEPTDVPPEETSTD